MRSRAPHIAIVVANLPAERDRRVIRECLTLERHGYQVTVIAPRGEPGLRVLPGSRDTRLKPYPLIVQGSGVLSFALEFLWSFGWVAFRLLGEVLRGRAHAVQVCNPPDVYWPLALLLRALRRPWVFDHHDLCPEVYATRSGGRPRRLVYQLLVWFEWLTLRTATAVVATNESYRENALRRGVRPDRVTVVRNGPASTEVAAVPPAAANGHRIVYLGVIGPQDNVEAAVLAAEELSRLRGRRDWRLVVAGDGEALPSLAKLVADRGLGDVVELTGWLDAAGVDELLRSATLAIQPDAPTRMNHLSTMAKTVEYLARGVPVVAVDLLETRRTAAEAAVYVPTGTPAEFAAALNQLLDDPAARDRMRRIGLERFAETLSWEHQAEAYVRVWDRLLARRRRRGGADRATPPDQATPPPSGPGTATTASVVIAAHNEADVIEQNLRTLLSGAPVPLDVTVVANGCTDDTARIARSVPGVRVIELPTAGKAAALNAGDAAAVGFPRIYLDADVRLSGADLGALLAALDTHPAAVPRRQLVLSGRSLPVRAYYAINSRLPAFRGALYGRGVVALSAAGRARFTEFPDLFADDLFLDSLFAAEEKQEVATVASRVATPRHTRDLVRRLTRVRAGNAALRRAVAGTADRPVRVRPPARLSWLRDVVLPRPWLAPAALCYVAITLTASLRARHGGQAGWGRDESSRLAPQ